MGTLLHQQGENLQADGIELERLASATHLQGIQVVAEVGDLQLATAAPLGPAHHRLDACGQFGHGEGLDQIVVGPGAKALQAVVELVARGEHDHRGIAAGILAQPLAEGVAVDAGQHDIEDEQIVMLGRGQVQAGQAVLGAVHAVALEAEVIQQVAENVAVVFHHQDTHVADLFCELFGRPHACCWAQSLTASADRDQRAAWILTTKG